MLESQFDIASILKDLSMTQVSSVKCPNLLVFYHMPILLKNSPTQFSNGADFFPLPL